MRWIWVIVLVPFLCFGQETPHIDTMEIIAVDVSPEWSTSEYSQEDKIYNRSVWTFVDNPALAGFDRKLAFAYRFQMKNLAVGVPNEDRNLELAFMKHEASIDLPFGGPKQNWGMGLHYNHEKEMQHTYHRIKMARSLRINLVKEHFLILGYSFGIQFGKLNGWGNLTYPDMIEPRAGFVYRTNEVRPNTAIAFGIIEAGLRYYWKRFSFDYAFHQGPNGVGGLAGYSQLLYANRFRTSYNFQADETITISPEILLDINNDPAKFGNIEMLSVFTTITYKDMAYVQLGVIDMNKLSWNLAYQLKDFMIIEVGFQSYINQRMQKIAGMANVHGGIRYQIKAWNR